MEEINVCCPYLEIMECGDTIEHKHIVCIINGELITNNNAICKCISDNKWILCSFYEVIEDND